MEIYNQGCKKYTSSNMMMSNDSNMWKKAQGSNQIIYPYRVHNKLKVQSYMEKEVNLSHAV